MKQWYMIIDVAKCEDCNNCFLSCKDEHVENDWPGYTSPQPRHGHRWMDILRKERGQYPHIDIAYRPTPCMHCGEAPCVKAAIKAGEPGAVYKREDGIVIIDPKQARGMRTLVNACPYGAIFWNEETDLPQKCTFCAHLLDQGWQMPRCVQACPTGALQVVKLEESEVETFSTEHHLNILKPELATKPHVLYKNLYRYDTCFIAGSVAYEENRRMECAAGARVDVRKDGDTIGSAMTDMFGDFKIDGIRKNSGTFTIEVTFGTDRKKKIDIDVPTSISLGTIML
jgi:Fe-S-cluster-containing dehydrogenase component